MNNSFNTNNNLNTESYFNDSKHNELLKICKNGALERIKYNFIEKIIKPNLLNNKLMETDPYAVDSRKEFLKILTLINNFAAYGFYYYLDKFHERHTRSDQISKMRQQLVEWIDFNKEKGIDSFKWNETDPEKMKEFNRSMGSKKYEELLILLNFNNSDPEKDGFAMDSNSRLLNVFLFGIARFDRHGYSQRNLDGTKLPGINQFSYKKGDLRNINFEDFASHNIAISKFLSNTIIPGKFKTSSIDNEEDFTKLIHEYETIDISDLLRDSPSGRQLPLYIGEKSLIGGIHKPILEIDIMYEPKGNGKVHTHNKMKIKRNYTVFKPGDIVRIYATQNRIAKNFMGKVESKLRGATGNTYGGHMAIEIEHFYINNGERKSDLYSFGFASGSVVDDEIAKPGFIDRMISSIPVVGPKYKASADYKGGAIYTPDYPLLGKTMNQLNISERAPKFNYIELVATGLLNKHNLSKLRSNLDEITIDHFYGSKLYNDTLNIKNISEYLTDEELSIITKNNIENQIRLGNLHYDIDSIEDPNSKLKQQVLLSYLQCNTFHLNTVTYYWGLNNMYCEMTHRDASRKKMPVYNCTSWVDSVFDDIIDCDKSKLTSSPDRCIQSKTYPFKGCDVNGELLFEHKNQPFGIRSRKMGKLLKTSREKSLARNYILTKTPRNNFYRNTVQNTKKKKSSKRK
jgi:hypothetical protein